MDDTRIQARQPGPAGAFAHDEAGRSIDGDLEGPYDLAAFELVYVRHRARVYAYLRSRMESEDDALELTAVTFERALAALDRFRSRDGGMIAWLLRIARNAALDDTRRRKSAAAAVERLARSGPQGGRDPASHEDAAALRDLVAALPDAQRDAIRLRFAGGLTAREIGAVLGRSEAAAQKLLDRGLRSLKEAYGAD